MHVISRRTLEAFWKEHADVEEQLKAWHFEAEHANWKSPSDVKVRHRSADILSGDRIVFNIKGNHYRLIVKVHYQISRVYVRFVGTHAEYDEINAEKV